MKDIEAIFEENLFVFDIANNHMGNVAHGKMIIDELSNITRDYPYQYALKFQFRDLDTFIHPEFKSDYSYKYVKRFQETWLDDEALLTLKKRADSKGFVSMCTPFDESSVDKIIDFGFDIIKVASCSFTDWPLLEKIAETDKPIIASTAGTTLEDIDRVVMFFKHRRKKFAIMHCVGEYPTLLAHLNLNQITFLQDRYQDVTIGYSTHEAPDNLDAIKMTIAKGASIFERHVGIATENYSLNTYSSSPEQVRKWLTSADEAFAMLGKVGVKRQIYEKEKSDLQGLRRGVFAKSKLDAGRKITMADIFFAIPKLEGQVAANDMSKYTEFIPRQPVKKGAPLLFEDVSVCNIRPYVLNAMRQVKNLLIESKVHLPHMLQFELSHHYGIDQFEKNGAIIINCVNRSYCKKIIIMLPGQQHPIHYHKRKEETFQILHGELILDLGAGEKIYRPGDIVLIEQEARHSFRSQNGTVFEEVSDTHHPDDSFYDDLEILKNKNRKTEMTFWTDWLYEPLH